MFDIFANFLAINYSINQQDLLSLSFYHHCTISIISYSALSLKNVACPATVETLSDANGTVILLFTLTFILLQPSVCSVAQRRHSLLFGSDDLKSVFWGS